MRVKWRLKQWRSPSVWAYVENTFWGRWRVIRWWWGTGDVCWDSIYCLKAMSAYPLAEECLRRWGLIYRKVMTAAEVSSPFIPTPGSRGKHSFAGINVEKADRKLIPESLELKQDVFKPHQKWHLSAKQPAFMYQPLSRWKHLWHLTKRTLFLFFVFSYRVSLAYRAPLGILINIQRSAEDIVFNNRAPSS